MPGQSRSSGVELCALDIRMQLCKCQTQLHRIERSRCQVVFGPNEPNFTEIRSFRLGPRQNQLGQKYFGPIQIFTLFYGPTRAHKCSSVSMTLKNFLTVPNFLTSRHQQLRLRSSSPLASATVATARVVVASLRPACAMYTPRCHPCAMAAP